MIKNTAIEEVLKSIEECKNGYYIFGSSDVSGVGKTVPENLRHSKILSIVDPVLRTKQEPDILKFYYSYPYKFDRSKKEPFMYSFDGAFLTYPFFYMFIHKLHSEEIRLESTGKPIKTLGDLYPYLLDYVDGFFSGFEGFENYIKNSVGPFISDDAKSTFITNLIKTNWKGFTGAGISGSIPKLYLCDEGYLTGEKYGRLYKAWSIVLLNQSIFSKHFKDDIPSISNFDCRYTTDSLTEIFIKLKKQVIHDDTSKEAFLSVMGLDWNSHEHKIKFQRGNAKAAIFIETMGKKCGNLNKSIAGRSKKFISEKETILTEGNLNSSKQKANTPEELEQVVKSCFH